MRALPLILFKMESFLFGKGLNSGLSNPDIESEVTEHFKLNKAYIVGGYSGSWTFNLRRSDGIDPYQTTWKVTAVYHFGGSYSGGGFGTGWDPFVYLGAPVILPTSKNADVIIGQTYTSSYGNGSSGGKVPTDVGFRNRADNPLSYSIYPSIYVTGNNYQGQHYSAVIMYD